MEKRAVGIIIKNNKVLLIRRIKDGREYFVFPGGGVKETETPEEAVVREIKEELGLKIRIDKFLFRIENKEREEFYFLIKEFSGIPKISGEEKERTNENNQYYPFWADLNKIGSLSNLYPEKAKEKVEKLIDPSLPILLV